MSAVLEHNGHRRRGAPGLAAALGAGTGPADRVTPPDPRASRRPRHIPEGTTVVRELEPCADKGDLTGAD